MANTLSIHHCYSVKLHRGLADADTLRIEIETEDGDFTLNVFGLSAATVARLVNGETAPASQTKPQVPWGEVDARFMWAARDENGRVWAYREMPDAHYDQWKDGNEAQEIKCPPGTCDWRDSLVKRPGA